VFVDQEGPDPNFSADAVAAAGQVVVTVTGEVDMATAETMRQVAMKHSAPAALVDLRAVTFFDSAAIHALLKIVEHYGAGLRVLPSAQVRRILEIAGLSTQPWLGGVSD
jgi:anti-anti-sigma factor